jgi:hypothetical protein
MSEYFIVTLVISIELEKRSRIVKSSNNIESYQTYLHEFVGRNSNYIATFVSDEILWADAFSIGLVHLSRVVDEGDIVGYPAAQCQKVWQSSDL